MPITEAIIRVVRSLSGSRDYLDSVEKHVEKLTESVEKRITNYTGRYDIICLSYV